MNFRREHNNEPLIDDWDVLAVPGGTAVRSGEQISKSFMPLSLCINNKFVLFG